MSQVDEIFCRVVCDPSDEHPGFMEARAVASEATMVTALGRTREMAIGFALEALAAQFKDKARLEPDHVS